MTTSEVEALQVEYRRLAVAWEQASVDSDRANAVFVLHQAVYRLLRATDDGQAAIVDLLDDPERVVRLLAATHSLAWAPDRAVAVLEQIERGNGLYAIDAKYTLIGYRKGTLNLDW